jgi:hypothetical protein
MAESDVWKSVREWRPVFDISRIRYGSAWEFCVILGVLGTAGLAKLVTVVVRKQPVRPRHLYTAVLLLMVFTLIAIITVSAYATDLNSRSVARHHPREVPIEVKHMFDLARMVLAGSLIVAGGAAVTGAVLFGRTRGSDTYRPAGPARLGMWAFDVLLSLLVVYMAFTARRFIPLAVVVIAPLVARQLQWVCSQRVVPLPGMKPATIATGVVIAAASIAGIAQMGEAGLFLLGGVALSIIWLANSLRVNSFRVCPPAVLAIAVAVLAGQLAAEKLRYYNPANPVVGVESFYDRMVGQERQATKMTRFMRENDIEGRILHEWRWEGYLHWRVPELKLLLGGRAQQIYSEQDYYTGMSLRYGSDTRTTVRSDDPFYTRRELDRLDVHLLAAPTEPGWKWLLVRLTQEDPRSGWTYLYRDGRDALLADTNDPEKRRLVEQALRGEMDYPSRGIEAFSQASILRTRAGRSIAEKLAQTGQGPKTTADRAFRLFLESLRLDPSRQAAIEAFNLFSSLKENIRDLNANSDKPAGQRPGDQLRQVYIDLLEAALAGMAERPLDQWGGYEILESRLILLRLLGEFYAQADRRERTQQVIQRVNRLRQAKSRLIEKWR